MAIDNAIFEDTYSRTICHMSIDQCLFNELSTQVDYCGFFNGDLEKVAVHLNVSHQVIKKSLQRLKEDKRITIFRLGFLGNYIRAGRKQ